MIKELSVSIGTLTKNYNPKKKEDRIAYPDWQFLTKSNATSYNAALRYDGDYDVTIYAPDGYIEYILAVPRAFILYLNTFATDTADIITTSNCDTITLTSSDMNTTLNKRKENTTMKMPTMNIDFGPVKSTEIQISPYGLAISTPNGWRAYDVKKNQTIDVTGFTFDAKGMVYKMPVAVKDVREGDMVMHQNVPMFVTGIDDDGSIEVIDITASELKIILPTTNIFNFNFVTKIVSLMNFNGIAPSADNPFGNIMPLMMMNELFGDNKNTSDGDGFMKMMMLSSMMNGSNPFANIFTPLNNN